jgi:hypothetical protein
VTKPPRTPPSSDIDGVAEDEVRNSEAAAALGQGTADLARAKEEGIARPDYADQDEKPAGKKD